MTQADIAIRALNPGDVDAYRALRLQALRDDSPAFSSSYEEEVLLSREAFAARLIDRGGNSVFGAFDGEALVGTAGFLASERLKSRHKGMMVGIYVAPASRGAGLAGRLVDTVIGRARGEVMLLECGVAVSNAAARRVYHARGFVPYGIEQKAILVDGVYHDEELLVLDLTK